MKKVCTKKDCAFHDNTLVYGNCNHPYNHAELEHQCIKNGFNHFMDKSILDSIQCDRCTFSYNCPIDYEPKMKPCEAYKLHEF